MVERVINQPITKEKVKIKSPRVNILGMKCNFEKGIMLPIIFYKPYFDGRVTISWWIGTYCKTSNNLIGDKFNLWHMLNR